MAIAVVLGSGVGSAQVAASERVWRSVRGLGPVEGIRDVAVDGARRFALADVRGVLIGLGSSDDEPDGHVQRITRLGVATRVRFDAGGGVWAVGEQGLVHVDRAGRVIDRTPRVGQGGRALLSLDVRDGWLAVGGNGGLFVARLGPSLEAAAEARPWVRVHEGLSAGLVTDLALGAAVGASGTRPLWAVAGGELHLVWLDELAGRVTASPARLQRIPGRPIGDLVRRVRVPADGSGVRVLYGRATARLVGAPLEQGDPDHSRWELAFPVLPPGAELMDVSVTGGRAWLASTAGVLVGDAAGESFVRATPPAGSRPTWAIAAGSGVVLAASRDELLRGEARPVVNRVRGAAERMPRDPELVRVHARALAHLGLRTREVERMWRGLGRRAWLPSVVLHGGIDYGSGHTRDYDESFSYGQLSQLNDEASERNVDYDAGIALSWDLADLAYSPEAVDLSREARQVIGLRDNVLDEINQLYFDRQRALRALSAYADWSDPEAAGLRLRALELAAGLDAWTGGWFSTQVELPAAARAAWRLDPSEPGALGGAPPAIPISHPEDPVPTHAGRESS